MQAILYTDGASIGNPGPAGIGVVLKREDGSVIVEIGEPIGTATNNEAEYRALIRGLEETIKAGVQSLTWVSDSELLVRQMKGEYQVRQPNLIPLWQRARELAKQIPHLEARYSPREGNALADRLARQSARVVFGSVPQGAMRLYYITFTHAHEAEAVGRALLERQLAVCVNWFPITCAYRWKGEIVQEPETVLIVKTREGNFEAIEQVVREHVDYTNFIAELAPLQVNRAFLEWLDSEVPGRT